MTSPFLPPRDLHAQTCCMGCLAGLFGMNVIKTLRGVLTYLRFLLGEWYRYYTNFEI